MLTEFLAEIKSKTQETMIAWIDNSCSNNLLLGGHEAINLKDDYERALIVRLGFQSIREDWHHALDAMASIELLDSSLLVVDDIVDESKRRKGNDSIHVKYGLKNTLILSHVLKSTSLLALINSAKTNQLNKNEITHLLNLTETTYQNMYFGEYQDLYYENESFDNISLDDYLDMIKRTTGLHLGLSFSTGGLIARSTKNYQNLLWEIGVRLGIILQIRDDFIDYLDLESVTQKPAYGDFLRRKKRLPLLLAYKHYPTKIKKLFNLPFEETVKNELLSVISDEKIKNDSNAIVSNIYSNTDQLLLNIKPSKVRIAVSEFFHLIRKL